MSGVVISAPAVTGPVPRISEFYGIAIYMYHCDHAPPHFHAIYAGWEAGIMVDSGALMAGSLPPAAQRLVQMWVERHRAELLRNWRRARRGRPLSRIAPLE